MIEALIFYLKSRDKEAAANGDQGRTIAPGEDIVTEGSHPGHSILMIEGLFRRDKQMADAPDILRHCGRRATSSICALR
jgi:hypothetical protein